MVAMTVVYLVAMKVVQSVETMVGYLDQSKVDCLVQKMVDQ